MFTLLQGLLTSLILIWASMRIINSVRSIGFEMKSLAPWLIARFRSSLPSRAVTTMIGTSRQSLPSRIRRITSKPSIFGIRMSSRSRSMEGSSLSNASKPLLTLSVCTQANGGFLPKETDSSHHHQQSEYILPCSSTPPKIIFLWVELWSVYLVLSTLLQFQRAPSVKHTSIPLPHSDGRIFRCPKVVLLCGRSGGGQFDLLQHVKSSYAELAASNVIALSPLRLVGHLGGSVLYRNSYFLFVEVARFS